MKNGLAKHLVWGRANGLCEQCHRKNPMTQTRTGKIMPRKELKVMKINAEGGSDPLNLIVLCKSCERWHTWNNYQLERKRKEALANDKRVGQEALFG